MAIVPGMDFAKGYTIVEELGRGGMGTVYKAYQPTLDRYVAIKVLPPSLAAVEGFRERFQREATTVARLRHTNIVVIYDYGEVNGGAYLVSELVEGRTLAAYAGSQLNLDFVERALAPIAGAIDYAHGQGILHRDIKPSNVLLARDGRPVLSDFGLVKLTAGTDSQPALQTAPGILVGTPTYMAPEYATGAPITAASDIYSLAVIAYELLTGQVPFTADTPLAVVLAHASKPLPPPRSINPAIPPAVEEVLQKALAKDPEARYSTASSFMAALIDAGRAEPPPATPVPELVMPSPVPAAATPAGTAQTGALSGGSAQRRSSSRSSTSSGSKGRSSASGPLPEGVASLYTRVALFVSKRLRTGRSRILAAGGLVAAIVIIAAALTALTHSSGKQAASPTVVPTGAPATAAPHTAGYTGPVPVTVASTVPANGDTNPYGVAVVPKGSGRLVQGAVLVSNFSNKKNLAGTGTTIVQITPDGKSQLFARIDPAHLPGPCPGGVGLSTALAVLQRYVVVGSVPTTDGKPATAKAGCLLVLNDSGQVISTIVDPNINGPWDMTAYDGGPISALFVANVLNGTVAAGMDGTNQGTIVRLKLKITGQGPPQVLASTVIGSGFRERADPAALVIGPTGLALGPDGKLYIADTLGNRIAYIPHAVTHASNDHTGTDVAAAGSLNQPLGLIVLPNGDYLTVNGGDGKMVRIKPDGAERGTQYLDRTGSSPGAGTLSGLALTPDGKGVYFVDDKTNTLRRVNLATP